MLQIIESRFIKTTFWLIGGFILLFIGVATALQTPYVQTRVIDELSAFLSKKTGFQTTIEHVALDWMDQISLRGIQINDPNGQDMIYIDRTTINYELKSLIQDKVIHLDKLQLDSLDLLITKIYDDSIAGINLNFFIKRIKKLVSDPNAQRKLEIGNIKLDRSVLRYRNTDKDSLYGRFDHRHFTLVDIQANLYDFTQRRDTISFDAVQLSANDQVTKLKVTNLQTKFKMSSKQMVFNALDVQFGKSRVTEKVVFNYPNWSAIGDFNNLVNIEAHLKNSVLYTDDLALFAPNIGKYNQKIMVTGDFKGKINRFNFSNFDIALQGNNSIQGEVSIHNITHQPEIFIDLKVSRSSIDASPFENIFAPKVHNFLSSLGRTQFNGKFSGHPNDFVAAGSFDTQMGQITSNIHLKIKEKIEDSEYSGHFEVLDFELGKFFKKPFLQKLTLDGEIIGKGLNFHTADFELTGAIEKIDILDYAYTNIHTNVHFVEGFFEGSGKINDPNLKLSLEGSLDLKDGKDNYKVALNLDRALLKPLNLSKKNMLVITDAVIDAKNLKEDSIAGQLSFRNTFIEYDGKSLVLDSVLLKTTHEKGNRTLTISSDPLDAKIEGSYNFFTVTKRFFKLLHEYELNLKNDQLAISSHYENKEASSQNQFLINYNINLKQFTPVIGLFKEDLKISSNTKVNGIYSSGYTSILSINTIIDTLTYKKSSFYNLEIDISTSKITDSNNVLASGFISSPRQKFINSIATENLVIESIWDNSQIKFGFNIEQKKHNNNMQVTGGIDFLNGTTICHFGKSYIHLFENDWKLDQNNQVSITKNKVQFSNFKLFNGQQSISLRGEFSTNASKRATLNFDNIDMGIMSQITTKKVRGSLNGFIETKDYWVNPSIESDITIDSLYVDDFLIGNFYEKTHWKNQDQALKIEASLDRQGHRTANINGYYHPKNQLNPLGLSVHLNQAPVNVLETLFSKLFSNIKGQTTGVFNITGKPTSPIINGAGSVEKGEIRVNYLNTTYTFDGDFALSKNKIKFVDITLNDILGAQASLVGDISHQGFKNMFVDLQSDLTTFQVLNTSSSDNTRFYGEGYATGQITFQGPINNMNINASAKSTKGTKIYIPINDKGSVIQEKYIHFTNFTSAKVDTTKTDILESIDIKGLTMNLDLDITPDAYCELIFDIKSGDIIRGRGNGQINLKINSNSDEFNMFGNYILDEGRYNFTLYNLINKEFDLLPNSKISWYGDPYQGILDINATYSQVTSLSPLVDTNSQNIPDITRGYPVELKLILEGPLLSPTVNFDINVKDYPKTITDADNNIIYIEDVVKNLESRISTDENELNRQVFSLIVLHKFSPPESLNTTGSLGNSVSELISNQLSYWVSQMDENLKVNVDLRNIDNEATNTFQLRLSYTLLNSRLQITREGDLKNQNQNISGIIGDWTVEYALVPDKKWKAKMYNRTSYNTLNNSPLNPETTIAAGISLLHTQNFDALQELFINASKSGKKQAKSIKKSTLKNKNKMGSK